MRLIKSRRYFRDRFRREEKHRINERVRAPEVRLIDEQGQLVGLMSSFSALKLAREKGLDLVEVHDKSTPPVCKIMDYGKWKFETKKKEKQNKKNQTKVLIKEIQFRPRTDEGDIKIKLEKAKEFLSQGHKVKLNLRFFGREMAHKELGFKLLKQVEDRLSDLAFPEMPAKMEKRILFTILAPHSPATKKKTQKVSPVREQEAQAKASPARQQEVQPKVSPVGKQEIQKASPVREQEVPKEQPLEK